MEEIILNEGMLVSGIILAISFILIFTALIIWGSVTTMTHSM